MDFTFSEEQHAVRELAAKIFGERAGTARVKEIEATSERIDRDLWAELAASGLLGIALPEPAGGGLGLVELALVLEQQGRRVAPLPLWQTATAALAIARFGTPAQHDALLPAVADGTVLLGVALEEFGAGEPLAPATRAAEAGGAWRLTGTKAAVPAGHLADRIVLVAATDVGPRLFLADPRGPGVHADTVDTTAHEPALTLSFEAAPAQPLGDADAPAWLLDRVQVALAALALGVADSALAQGAAYVSERRQFGRPLGTFQAVAHALADCYLDVAAMRATLWQAAWRLDAGEDPGTAVRTAAWWAQDGAERVVHRVQHVHGGIGVDVDYPIHRFLLWGKQLAGMFGGPAAQLARLGEHLDDRAE